MIVGYNNIPNQNVCFGGNTNCTNCSKKYNCSKYMVTLLENIPSGNFSILEQVVKNLETMQNLQEQNLQAINSKIDNFSEQINGINQIVENKINSLENNVTESLNNVLATTLVSSRNTNEPEYMNAEVVNLESNTALATQEDIQQEPDTIWKEKKTIFGKTKWVEEKK